MKFEIWSLKLFLLALFWILWCAVHSFLISPGVVRNMEGMLGDRFRYYRTFYNLVSVVTLVPVVAYSVSLRSESFFTWSGAWRPVQILLFLGALTLFFSGARHYDLKQFLGVRQVMEHRSGKGLTETGGLDTSGILGIVRHPLYTGGMLIIWARPLDMAVLVTNLVLTAYLLIGAVLEERKLVAEFGAEYREYQKKVPMFFPGFKGERRKEKD